ncbi:MAG: ABC transporter substrate-binding protein [Firmicutes bacterium]|nr:ABC transporter substrate-binding protein [Bacillota bacterium]
MKRLAQIVALSVAFVMILGVQAMAKTVTITYWHGFTGPDMPYMQQLIKKFNETHPGIVVKAQAIPWGNLFQQLQPVVAAGRAPDVVAVNEDVITGFSARGALTELTPAMLKSAGIDKSRFYPVLWNTAVYKGKVYGVPIHSVALVEYYNKKLLDAAGVDPTKLQNREQFLAALQKLTIDKNGKHANEPGFDPDNVVQWGTMIPLPWMGGSIYYSMLLQNGGAMLNADGTKAVFNSPQAVEALQFLVDLIYKYHVSPANVTEDGSIAAFRQGKEAFVFNGVWRYEDFKGQQGLDFGVAPFPRLGTREDAAWGGSSYLALPRQRSVDAARQKAALAFVNWMTEPAQDLYWTGAGSLPTQPVVAKDASFEGKPMKPVFAGLQYVHPFSGFPWVAQVRAALDEAVGNALLKKETPKSALDAGVSEANKQIADAMANQ